MKFKMISLFVVLIITWSTWISCNNKSDGEAHIPDKISYNFHVRPILSDKCFACHGPDKNHQEAGLRLDIPENAFAPLRETRGAFALVPGKPEESEVYKRIISKDSSYQMPAPSSHLDLLTEREIKIFEKWIRQGAKYEKHWAFSKPQKTALPPVSNNKWAKNEIDNFIVAKLDETSLAPNEEAGKDYLLKRVSLDITGLLPNAQMMDEFNADKTDDAYEKVVDKLLATPQYGEKMAVHWLDIARYSDSYGYQDDNIRTQWPYRDWVIHALNKNLPYDSFITWQLAGDMLPKATKEQVLATAFLRNHKYTEEGGIVPEEYRVEYILDKVKTFSKGILALTVECAQCHDHKYDPVSQKDYYRMFGFFNSSKELGFEGDVSVSKPAKQPVITFDDKEVKNVLTFINKKDTGTLMVSVMGEMDTLRPTYLLKRGVYDQHGDTVAPAAPAAVMRFDAARYKSNRLGLAEWTVSKDNPLTARVFVNHLWQNLFGTGLVKSTGDFGMQGNLPTHPELLDWLAVDFMEHNWDIKRLVKKMVMSATYRQSSRISENQWAKDPENIYLSRSKRQRISAEFIRDIILQSSGLLVKEIGGPSVKPYQPKGLWEVASSGRGVLATYKQDKDESLYRRGLYTFIKLTLPPPGMMMFDASNRDQCEVKRPRTSTPLQALIMMNDPTVLEASRVLAQRLQANNQPENEMINTAFRTIICRRASKKEMEILTGFYKDQLQLFKSKKLDARKILTVGEKPLNEKLDLDISAALMKVISTIYNMEEALTKS